jgi:hypothetical protein
VGDRPGALTLTPDDGQRVNEVSAGTRVRAEFAVDDLVAGVRSRQVRRVRFRYTVLGTAYTRNVSGLDLASAGRIRHRRGLRVWFVTPGYDPEGRLTVAVDAVSARRVGGWVLRKLGVMRKGAK